MASEFKKNEKFNTQIMEKNLYIDASHPDETRIVLKSNSSIEEYEFEDKNKLNFKNNLDHFLSIYPYTKNNLKEKLLSKKFNHKKINMNIKNYFKSIFSKIKTENYSDKMQFFFQKFHLTGILEREDISSMAASVELRVPFLDHRIVEFAASLPLKYKIRTIARPIPSTLNDLFLNIYLI